MMPAILNGKPEADDMNVREAVLTVDETQTSFLEHGPSLIERAARTATVAAADADGVDRDARFPTRLSRLRVSRSCSAS